MSDTGSIVAASQATAGAAGAYGTYQAGAYNSRLDRWNARVAELQATDAIGRGEVAVARHRTQVAVLKGSQRAALAAQGVVLDDGSAADVIADTDRQSAIDEQQIRANAALEAWGYRVQATDERARASIAMAKARSDASGELMSTVGRFATTGYKLGLFDQKKPQKLPAR